MAGYICSKCKCTTFSEGQFQATGSTLSKLFDVQTEKFLTVSCTNCGFTEIFKRNSDMGENIIDLLFGG